tara:strand:+ start:132 stop:530 length:399 start_codon:yes stop_codon:yes gene_type:complete
MALHFSRNDQTTVFNIATEFINFYYTCLNQKNTDSILPYLRDFTIYSSQKNRYQGEKILEYFNNIKETNAQFTDIDYDTLHSGARRINILVTGTISYNLNGTITINKFSEFIHLATGKENEMWIQMSMMKFI